MKLKTEKRDTNTCLQSTLEKLETSKQHVQALKSTALVKQNREPRN